MNDHLHNLEELLLDAHLDQLDDTDRQRLNAWLTTDLPAQKKNERLARLLRPLDLLTPAAAPANLAEKILKRVGQSSLSGPVLSPEKAHGGFSRPLLSLRELGAVAACLILFMGALIPTVSRVRSHSHRVWCESNLGSIYRGLSAYQGDFDGSLPYRGSLTPTAWMPGGTDLPFASNSRHGYALVRGGYVGDTQVFLCPADRSRKPMNHADAYALDDFPDAHNTSYDFLNLAGGEPNVRPSVPIVYLGDANPLFNNGRIDETVDPSSDNSFVHKKSGQNVLILDGSSRFLTTPVYGDQRDNVWMAGSLRKYTGSETPSREDDAQLVPGFSPSTAPRPAAPLK